MQAQYISSNNKTSIQPTQIRYPVFRSLTSCTPLDLYAKCFTAVTPTLQSLYLIAAIVLQLLLYYFPSMLRLLPMLLRCPYTYVACCCSDYCAVVATAQLLLV